MTIKADIIEYETDRIIVTVSTEIGTVKGI